MAEALECVEKLGVKARGSKTHDDPMQVPRTLAESGHACRWHERLAWLLAPGGLA
jgi:hypothetical protein